MKKCPKGHENPDHANFCRICGHKFNPESVDVHRNTDDLEKKIFNLEQEREKKQDEKIKLDEELKKERKDNVFLREKILSLENLLQNSFSSPSPAFSSPSPTPPPSPSGKSTYTPDVFPYINFVPRSTFKPGFLLLLWLILLIIFAMGMDVFLKHYARHLETVPVLLLLTTLIMIFAITFMKRLIGLIAFNHHADFVEIKPMTGISRRYHRIGKKGKLGLFDSQNKVVRVLPRYDSIEKYDRNHLLIGLSGKVGLYSLVHKKMIVPVRYSRIEPIKNYMIEAIGPGGVDHYDIKGNLKG